MNYHLIIALFSTIVPLVMMWKKYGIISLLHPFNYYLITWVISIFSLYVALYVGLDFYIILNETLLEQLLVTISFVGISISLVLIFIPIKRINKENDRGKCCFISSWV